MERNGSESAEGRRFGPLGLVSLALALGLAWLALAFASGRALVAPQWLTDEIEERATAALAGQGRIEIGSLVAVLGEAWVPRLVLRDLKLTNAVGAEVAQVPELRLRFSPQALVGGQVRPTRLTVVGADLTVRRDREGRFDIAFGAQARALRRAATVPEILTGIDRVLSLPALEDLSLVAGEALRLTFQDASTGRVWRAENGTLALDLGGPARTLTVGFAVTGGVGRAPAPARITLSTGPAADTLSIAAEVEGVAAADLAAQVPAFDWLAAADAPLSVRLRGGLDAEGKLARFDGALVMGAGAIVPGGAARPVAFDGARAYLSYDPAARRFAFSEISATTPEARFRASGQALLRALDPDTGRPGEMLVQLALADIEIDPRGEMSEPVRFETGAVDLRIGFAPLKLDLGQLALVSGPRRFSASGRAEAGPGGWSVSLDAKINEMPHDRLLALWPLRAVPRTREWLAENVLDGLLTDVHAALRLRPGTAPRLALSYQFRDATVRFMRTLPPIVGGSGHAAIEDERLTLALSKGEVVSPNGETIRTDGSVFTIPDLAEVPAVAEVRLETESSIPAALALLDEPPFRFLTKAGRPTDAVAGRARLSSLIRLPLVRDLAVADVDFAVGGRLTDLRSETLVPGRTLEADEMTLTADGGGLTISGPGRIGGAEFDAAWVQPFGPESEGGSRVEGELTLDRAFLDEFGIALPPGSLSGSAAGTVTIDLPREGAPAFRLTSGLVGAALSVPALGWSKAAGAAGSLEVAGRLGSPAEIERLRLDAPGLLAEGRVVLGAGGRIERLAFSRVRAGRWLDAPVTLTARGAGRPLAVSVQGGTLDLREADFGSSRAGQGGPISLALDRLIVSEGIAFSGLRAELGTQGGLNGRFTGLLAGQAPVSGVLAPSANGTAIRLQAADAGAALRASGLLQSARQGQLDLTLVPLRGQGRYDGRFRISNLRVQGASGLASLLSAISVVGLLEQLDGQGIAFGEVTGEFTLEPRGITLRRGSAVGPSLGISMAGVYDLRSRRIDMQGTISPVYFLNAIGQIFSRQGEGLFGFNYRMSGPASEPGVTVNPLSILTPGMFREIFRANPPALTQ